MLCELDQLLELLLLASIFYSKDNRNAIDAISYLSESDQEEIKLIIQNKNSRIYDYKWTNDKQMLINDNEENLHQNLNNLKNVLISLNNQKNDDNNEIFKFILNFHQDNPNQDIGVDLSDGECNNNQQTNNGLNNFPETTNPNSIFYSFYLDSKIPSNLQQNNGHTSSLDNTSGYFSEFSPIKRNSSTKLRHHKQEVDGLRKKLKTQADVEEMIKYEYEELKVEAGLKDNYIAQLRSENLQLNEVKYYNNNLKEELEEAKIKINELSDVYDKNKSLMIRSKDLEYYQDKWEKQHEELMSIKEENTHFQHIMEELKKQNENFSGTQEKNERLKRDLINMELKVSEQIDLIEQFKMNITSLETEIISREQALNSTQNGSKTDLDVSTTNKSLLQEQFDEQSLIFQKLKTENTLLQSNIEDLKSDKSKMTGDASKIEEKFRQELKEKRDDINRLKTDISTLQQVNKLANLEDFN